MVFMEFKKYFPSFPTENGAALVLLSSLEEKAQFQASQYYIFIHEEMLHHGCNIGQVLLSLSAFYA